MAESLQGRRVLITGAARGIGAALARRLHERGARVAIAGIEPELLAGVAADLGAPHWTCDVTDRAQVDEVVAAAVSELGGLDVVVANAGVAAQLPLIGGDPEIFDRTLSVNVFGTYNTLRAAGPHLSHPKGYAVAISSLGGAIHLPLMGAYSTSKAAVEALGNTLRQELRPSGGRVGVAYFAELDTDMTTRGFGTDAAQELLKGSGRGKSITKVTPLETGIRALERGIEGRHRIIVAPWWVRPALSTRMAVQLALEPIVRRNLAAALETARREHAPLTTPQPSSPPEP
jgi:NAD(P)-dependent dehydrogenase (short-subunit alcohol dehydrogenase family)